MIELFNYLKNYLNSGEFLGNDFAVAGILSALFYSVIGYIKPLPFWIYGRLQRLIYYSVTVEQTDELFTYVDKWITLNYPNKLRKVEVFIKEKTDDSHYIEDEDDYIESLRTRDDSVKYRHHDDFFTIFYKFIPIFVEKNREKLDNASSLETAYLRRIRLSGIFAKYIISKIIDDAMLLKPTKNKGLKVYRPNQYGHWSYKYIKTPKTMNNLYFPEKEVLINRIDEFNNSRDTYLQLGVDWYLGILLYGIPGSGKSSIGKAISEYTNRDLYITNLSNFSNSQFEGLFTTLLS